MKIGERLFWRVFAADILLAALWLILGGSLLEAIIMAVLQGFLLVMIEGVIRMVHQLSEDVKERRLGDGRKDDHAERVHGRAAGRAPGAER